MPSRASTPKLAVRKTVASEAIAASEVEIAERILARFVALAYIGDHPDLIAADTEEQPAPPVPCGPVVTSVAPNGFREPGGTT